MSKKTKWNKIPTDCVYKSKNYKILSIDLQGGFFALQDLSSEKGDVQVIENVNMDECLPIVKVECERSPNGKHSYILAADSWEQPYCKYCYKQD